MRFLFKLGGSCRAEIRGHGHGLNFTILVFKNLVGFQKMSENRTGFQLENISEFFHKVQSLLVLCQNSQIGLNFRSGDLFLVSIPFFSLSDLPWLCPPAAALLGDLLELGWYWGLVGRGEAGIPSPHRLTFVLENPPPRLRLRANANANAKNANVPD